MRKNKNIPIGSLWWPLKLINNGKLLKYIKCLMLINIFVLFGCDANKDTDFFSDETKIIYLFSESNLSINGKTELVATNELGKMTNKYSLNTSDAGSDYTPMVANNDRIFISAAGNNYNPNYKIFEFNKNSDKVLEHNLGLNVFDSLKVDSKNIYGASWLNGETLYAMCSLKNNQKCIKKNLGTDKSFVEMNVDTEYLYVFMYDLKINKFYFIKYEKETFKELDKTDITDKILTVDKIYFYKDNFYFMSDEDETGKSPVLIKYDFKKNKMKKIDLPKGSVSRLVGNGNKIIISYGGEGSDFSTNQNEIIYMNLDTLETKKMELDLDYFLVDIDKSNLYIYTYDEKNSKSELNIYNLDTFKYIKTIDVPQSNLSSFPSSIYVRK